MSLKVAADRSPDGPHNEEQRPGTHGVRRWLCHVSIRVAHSCPLVAAGLVATLQQLAGCDVLLAGEVSRARLHPMAGVQVIVTDQPSCTQMLTRGATRTGSDHATRPRLVLLTAERQDGEKPDPMEQDADACLPLDCGTEDLLATVRQLGRDALGSTVALDRGAPLHGLRGGLPPGILSRACEYMEQHLTQGVDLVTLAGLAGISVCHFSRAFKQSLGMPPHHYLITRRVSAAMALIRDTDRPLSDISLEAGFADQSHFSRTFVRLTGETPGDFRHRNH